MDCSSPGFPVHGISRARILEWVAISFLLCDNYSKKCLHIILDWIFTTTPWGWYYQCPSFSDSSWGIRSMWQGKNSFQSPECVLLTTVLYCFSFTAKGRGQQWSPREWVFMSWFCGQLQVILSDDSGQVEWIVSLKTFIAKKWLLSN